MNSAIDIASFFVKKGVSPLQLQKLLYYAQVWFFVKTNRWLFSDEIKAWKYGPVVPDIWQRFKYMRRTDIIPHDRLAHKDYPGQFNDHLQQVWDAYGHLTGSQLVDLSHGELPWQSSRIGLLNNQPSRNPVVIDKNTTKDFMLNDGKIPFISPQPSRGNYSNRHV